MPSSPRGTPLGAGYVLQAPIGEGPTGTVWRGAAPDGSPVAIKVLHPRFASDPAIIDRFRRQLPLLEPLASTLLVHVRDLVIEAPTLAIVMDLVIGTNLREYLREQGTIRPALAFELAEQVLNGLSVVHHSGLLHHDLKPENVMVDLRDAQQPHARVTDAGIVHGIGPSVYAALGASPYRASEQGPERPETVGSDIFAVGAMLIEMLTGKPPVPGAFLPVVAGLPTGPATAVRSLLAADPDDRPRSASAARSLLVEAADPLIGIGPLPPVDGAAQWQESQRPTNMPDLLLHEDDEARRVAAEAAGLPIPTRMDSAHAPTEQLPVPDHTQPRPPAPPPMQPPMPAPPPGQGGFGQVQPAPEPGPSRQPLLLGALALVVVALLAVLLIWRPFGSDDAETAQPGPRPATTPTATPTTPTPGPSADPADGPTRPPIDDGSTLSPAELRRLPSNTPAEQASPEWGSVRDIASAFPNTVPADPDDEGLDGQSCANVEVASAFSTGKVLCKYPNGQQMSLQSYDSRADRNKRAAQMKELDTTEDVVGWRVGSGEGQRNGALLIGTTDEGEPYRWWTYDQADEYAVYVRWPGHTTKQLADWWDEQAPF